MRITLIGSGSVATHLSAALVNAGHQIIQVWSRSFENASLLAYYVKAEPIQKLVDLDTSVDLMVIAVKDDAIVGVVLELPFQKAMLVHTSGSTSLSLLNGASANTGVLYPLQTFSKTKEVDFSKVPVLIEGSSPEVLNCLEQLAASVSGKVIAADSEKRLLLHVAAVFACNFSNYLYSLSKEITDKSGLDFSLLHPLIAETTEKALNANPSDVQTGPAARNDQQIIAKHLQYLEFNAGLHEVYYMLSQSIINFYHKP